MLRILSYLMAATPLMPTRQRGATLVEYALILGLIAVVAFAGVNSGLGDAISGIFTSANEDLGTANSDGS